jgi:site-specific DNA-methyltransferase (adenine-specific)
MNKLYFGDNLEILREYIGTESIDLIYLDPPFNSKAQYNVLFRSPDSEKAAAQAGAFRDTWSWGEEAERSFADIMRLGGAAAKLLDALRSALGESDMMAYLAMMAVRLLELHRVLKPTGSLYLHCDPTASHFLKTLLDSIFGGANFGNEIIWRRQNAKGLAFKRFARNHDVILRYTKSDNWMWNSQYTAHNVDYVHQFYKFTDDDGRVYRLADLTNPNKNRPNLTYEFLGVSRVWRWTKDRMEQALADGLIVQSKPGQVPALKRYLDEQEGNPVDDIWTDIAPVQAQARERIGYPTQKPIALLERIINASSNSGDIVLDPFCGCGTTIEAAEKLRRQWIGIDIAVHAIKVIEARLSNRIGKVSYKEEGVPRDFASATALAERDKYQFQWWANYLFNPHALREHGKKGADRGIDGELFFPNGPGRPWGRMLTSVKGGERITPAMVREFAHVLDRESAQMGLFICLKSPTRDMVREAISIGFADTVHGQMPKLQIVALEEWFDGQRPKLPPLEHLPSAAFSPSAKAKSKPRDLLQPELPLTFVGGKTERETVRYLNPKMIKGAA